MDISQPVLLVDNSSRFPDPEGFDDQGLLAVGGSLSPTRLLQAYSQGIFPWYEPRQPILWWSPNPRLILNPHAFILTRSLRQTLKKSFRFTIDTAFSQVIQACATAPGRMNKTWIGKDMQAAYGRLHQLGYAHSFEVWSEDELVGGLYGVSLGQAFFGESMFHHLRDASKLALYFLCQQLLVWKFDFIDCQLPTEHLQRMGAQIISRHQFLLKLEQTLRNPSHIGFWTDKITFNPNNLG